MHGRRSPRSGLLQFLIEVIILPPHGLVLTAECFNLASGLLHLDVRLLTQATARFKVLDVIRGWGLSQQNAIRSPDVCSRRDLPLDRISHLLDLLP